MLLARSQDIGFRSTRRAERAGVLMATVAVVSGLATGTLVLVVTFAGML